MNALDPNVKQIAKRNYKRLRETAQKEQTVASEELFTQRQIILRSPLLSASDAGADEHNGEQRSDPQ